MQLAIISDIHDNLPNLQSALTQINQLSCEALFCCGDITNIDTLKFLSANFQNEIYFCLGNGDVNMGLEEISKTLPNVECFGPEGEKTIDNITFGFTHTPDQASHMTNANDEFNDGEVPYNIIFYGHTHKPWEEEVGGIKLVNPGNIAGIHYQPTFAIFNTTTEKLELHMVNNAR